MVGVKGNLANIIIPAIGGLITGYVANKSGYDITAIEGMKQTLLASLPLEALISIDVPDYEISEMNQFIADSPYLVPISAGVLVSASCLIGSYPIEWLSNTDINQKVVASSGALGGFLYGVYRCAVQKLETL